ncbi:MAG: NAD(P)H-dependent flavin oxidoreductase [Ostreibacterium sp.]
MNITESLGLTLPLFQAPLECYPNQINLVAEVSNNGGLGIYSANYQSLTTIKAAIREIKTKTDKSFAVFVDVADRIDKIDLADRSVANHDLKTAYKALNINNKASPSTFASVASIIETIIQQYPAAIIFQNGLPDDKLIQSCQAANIITMAVVSTPLEALAATQFVEILILQGQESAGIHSRFPYDSNNNSYPCNTLLHHALQNVSSPLVVWGDYQSPQNAIGALVNGASAIVLDTLFWTTEEANIPAAYREHLANHNETKVTITERWVGYPAQTLKNKLTQAKRQAMVLSPRQQQRIMLPVIQAAIEQNNPEYMPMWAGLCVASTNKTVAQLCQEFLQKLNEIIK